MTWIPLPPAARAGRHLRASDRAVRPAAIASVFALLLSSVALGAAAGDDGRALASASRTGETTVDVFVAAGVVTAPPVLPTVATTSTTTPPTTSTTKWAPTTTSLVEPTSDDIGLLVESTSEGLEPLVLAPLAMSVGVRGAPIEDTTSPTTEDCMRRAKTLPLKVDGHWDRNLIAQMTHEVFSCVTAEAGLTEVSPTMLRRWNGSRIWGFESLSEQVAAESVVVAYCESEGFRPSALTGSNAFGYAGLFQMGRTEMARFAEPGGSRYDPVDNAIAAANYFVFQYRNRAGWGGWSPWAVVNTNFADEVNDQVKVPVLPRFVSTDPEYAGRRGVELPSWAVDPWSWVVPAWPGTGCPFTGWRWPAAVPIARS